MSIGGHLSTPAMSNTAGLRGCGTISPNISPSRVSRSRTQPCTAHRRHHSAGRAGRDGEEAERSGGGSRQLPREQGWLLDEAVSRLGVKAVGPGFVMTRPGSQGLVKSPAAKVQTYQRKGDVALGGGAGGNLSLALACMQQQSDTGLVLFQLGGAPISERAIVVDDAIDVDFTRPPAENTCRAIVKSSPQAAAAAQAAAMGSRYLGIVPIEHAAAEEAAVSDPRLVVRPSASNPRRTMKVKFTCDRCGVTTIAPVNPTAFATGSVFGACGGCGVVHKLVDNLKLFHEVNSHQPVRIPASLPQNPGLGIDTIGGFDFNARNR
eukprot:CAMPEP_0206134534 /NCGR_PEP_ID=MMETSP1473-20131121/64_1 /ASSEMBLY_ACC=CAM_ASM_001109 /TAXON_ID=1461547 /ORGANISM="Stichococcus sp, Strain RCC1054" /LENGTH=320 /DNA_ID=CAMNT_0053526149 /DNA_START=66 /DNA_END=1028 /DNA_ORIENTATION=+